jgi:hypothetical protein
MAISSLPRCAVCARPGRSLFQFRVLAEGCKKYGVKLKAPRSDHFHDACARRAYDAIRRKAPPVPDELKPFLDSLAELAAEAVLRDLSEEKENDK